MRVTWVSRKGGRAVNEDAAGKLTKNGVTCVAVADGLGGHNAGEVASKTALGAFLNSFSQKPVFSAQRMTECFEAAHEAVRGKSMTDPDYIGMSSTLTALMIKGGRALWCHVGDSRLYRFRSGRIAEVTEDHSLAFRDFMNGVIEYDDIRRSRAQNKLTNAVGLFIGDMKVSEIRREDRDTDFLLCTDGWWEYVTEDDMESTLSGSANSREWLERMLGLRESRAAEGSDNYTAAAVAL